MNKQELVVLLILEGRCQPVHKQVHTSLCSGQIWLEITACFSPSCNVSIKNTAVAKVGLTLERT